MQLEKYSSGKHKSEEGKKREEGLKKLVFDFNRSLHIEPTEERISANGGALLLRQIDDQLEFFCDLAKALWDPRNENLCTYSIEELLRTRCILMALGYHDQDDADALRHDPVLNAAVTSTKGTQAIDQPLCSQPTLSRLVDMLDVLHNRHVLRDAVLELAIRAFPYLHNHRHRQLTVDLDSTDTKAYGYQQGVAYNGYYEERCYHPLMAFLYETGDLAGAWLRKGNVSSARGALEFVLPIIERVQGSMCQVANVRGDAAFADPRLMNALDERGIGYVFRIKRNPRLEELAAPYLTPTLGRPAGYIRQWTYELEYAARSWDAARRVVLVVIDDPSDRFMGQCALRHFFLVTSHTVENKSGEELVEFYRQRGTIETWIGEFKREMGLLLSSPLISQNRVTLYLFAIAYQLTHIARCLTDRVERREMRQTLGLFRPFFLWVAVRMVVHARAVKVRIKEEVFSVWEKITTYLRSRVQRIGGVAVAGKAMART